jgi:two-component system, sporulation sensor kinase E
LKPAFIEKLIGRMDRLDPKNVASVVSRLVEEKGFFETIFNALDEGVLVLNLELKPLYLNRAAHEMLGIKDESIGPEPLRRLLPEPFWQAVAEDLRGNKLRTAVHHDIEIFYPQHRFLQIYVTRFQHETSQEPIVLLILRDITEAHKEAALSAESERIGAVTHLAAGVAHEIGNPLNSLHIYMQLLERELKNFDPVKSKKLREHVAVCSTEIARLDQIVNQFLKAVRPNPPALEPRSIHEIISEVLQVLEPEIANRDVLVEKEFASDLPKILADRNQLKQVFFNIIRNSLQAMTKGGMLHIRTELQTERIMIAFRDTGGGIPSEVLQHIFEPYFTTKKEGSGLGLMIVQRVIREHGGVVDVSSEQGRGTTFRIFLPLKDKLVRLLTSEP